MLHAVGLLDHAASQRFGDALWTRVDDIGLPSDTNYYRFAFLSLPHPTNVDPVERFIRYVGSIRVSQRYFGAFRCFSWVI